jgi:hypothetical protein
LQFYHPTTIFLDNLLPEENRANPVQGHNITEASMRIHFLVVIIALLTCQLSAQTSLDSVGLPPGDSPPPTVVERVKSAGEAADYENVPYIIVYDESVNRVNELGITYTDNHLLFKILTNEGCKALSVVSQRYEPLSSFIEYCAINIIRGDSILPVSLEMVKDLPAPQSGIYWGDRIKMLQMPHLRVGDGVEIKFFRKGYSYALLKDPQTEPEDEKYIPPMPGQYFDIVLFEATAPIVEKKYVLKLPSTKRLHSQVYNGPVYCSTTYDSDTTTFSWWVKDMAAWRPETFRPDESDFLTKVVLATVETWEAKSRWFFEINEGQFEVTDAISNKVYEILADAGVSDGTEEEKAFELVHWVAQNIRYSGQTMGEGEGYTLHTGAMILEQRSGVCKDIAGMLVVMMRAAGMDSYGAMTMAGSRIETVPADQFNHCVVALRKADGSFEMYDPTWVGFDKDIWSKLETEQHYLIGSPEGEILSQIRYSPPEENPLNIKSNCSISKDGSLIGHLEMTADGAMDHYLRGLVSWFSREEREHYLLRMLSKISNAIELKTYEYGNVLDFSKPMWWKITYKIPQYAMVVADGLEFRSPLMQFTSDNRILFRAASSEWPEERHDDVFFYFTEYLDGSETVRLPGGYSVEDPPKSDEIDETYAYFSGSSEMDNSKLIISQQAKIKRRQVPPAGYDGFRKAMNEARDFATSVFRATKGGEK